jgi:hypothetical protein
MERAFAFSVADFPLSITCDQGRCGPREKLRSFPATRKNNVLAPDTTKFATSKEDDFRRLRLESTRPLHNAIAQC